MGVLERDLYECNITYPCYSAVRTVVDVLGKKGVRADMVLGRNAIQLNIARGPKVKTAYGYRIPASSWRKALKNIILDLNIQKPFEQYYERFGEEGPIKFNVVENQTSDTPVNSTPKSTDEAIM